MPEYRVRFETDQDADTPQQAAALAWEDLRADDSVPDQCTVIDKENGTRNLIDLSQPIPAQAPPLTSLALFRYGSRVNVTFEAVAQDENAAFALLDDVSVQVRALGQPVRQRSVRIARISIADDPEPLPGLADSPGSSPGSAPAA